MDKRFKEHEKKPHGGSGGSGSGLDLDHLNKILLDYAKKSDLDLYMLSSDKEDILKRIAKLEKEVSG